MRSNDAGTTWEQLGEGLPNPLLNMIECLEFDPDDSQSMVIATGGEGARYVKLDRSEVYLSVNRGEQWEEIIGGLPNIGSLALQ
jgi:hypothetical protein